MENKNNMVVRQEIENRIFNIRGVQIMVDRDLATFFNIETRVINQAVKRNSERFPDEFCFQLTDIEFVDWKSQTVMSNQDKMGLRRPPFVFTEQGVAMLSAVLRSETAVKVSIQIINAFVEMRKILTNHAGLLQRMDKVETKLIETDAKFERIFSALESNDKTPLQGVFFDGQIFDAYTFVADIVRKANTSII